MSLMRALPALLGLFLLTAAAPRDWSVTATRLPNGAYLVGNPAAKVKLVEYASYTCSHCAHFATESKPVLKGAMIRSGSTSLELRHVVRDALDLSAVVVARCGGPAGFARVSDAIFAGQERWLPQGAAYAETNAARLGSAPLPTRLRALADGAGLSAVGRANGLTDARLAACFADADDLRKVLALTEATPASVRGTPAFFVGGRQAPASDWAGLQPILRAQGAK
jgi:protein-disulfide isomerase